MIALAAMAVAALSADPAFGRVTERAKACISANAADVERAEASLSEAATFLLEDLCGVPVSIREKYQASATWAASLQQSQTANYDEEGSPIMDPKIAARMKAIAAKQRESYARATINEETGDLEFPKDAPNGVGFLITAASARGNASPELRAFAAKALLDARKARLARQ